MRIRNTKDIKYFLYISSAKLDMLYSQVSTSVKEKKATEWKIDLKFLSYSKRTEGEPNDTQEARLEAVIEALDKAGQIGTVDEPREYVRGTYAMKWGIYGDAGRPDAEPPLVYFGGATEETVFGLGGSSRHVIGSRGASNTESRSVTPYLVAHLLQGLEIPKDGWNCYGPRDDTENGTFEAVLVANDYLKGPTQNMDFVAKSLLRGKIRHHLYGNEKMNVLLATPIYITEVKPFAKFD